VCSVDAAAGFNEAAAGMGVASPPVPALIAMSNAVVIDAVYRLSRARQGPFNMGCPRLGVRTIPSLELPQHNMKASVARMSRRKTTMFETMWISTINYEGYSRRIFLCSRPAVCD
jgi:hypothetical protein